MLLTKIRLGLRQCRGLSQRSAGAYTIGPSKSTPSRGDCRPCVALQAPRETAVHAYQRLRVAWAQGILVRSLTSAPPHYRSGRDGVAGSGNSAPSWDAEMGGAKAGL